MNKLVGNQERPRGSRLFPAVAYVAGRRMKRSGFYSEESGALSLPLLVNNCDRIRYAFVQPINRRVAAQTVGFIKP